MVIRSMLGKDIHVEGLIDPEVEFELMQIRDMTDVVHMTVETEDFGIDTAYHIGILFNDGLSFSQSVLGYDIVQTKATEMINSLTRARMNLKRTFYAN